MHLQPLQHFCIVHGLPGHDSVSLSLHFPLLQCRLLQQSSFELQLSFFFLHLNGIHVPDLHSNFCFELEQHFSAPVPFGLQSSPFVAHFFGSRFWHFFFSHLRLEQHFLSLGLFPQVCFSCAQFASSVLRHIFFFGWQFNRLQHLSSSFLHGCFSRIHCFGFLHFLWIHFKSVQHFWSFSQVCCSLIQPLWTHVPPSHFKSLQHPFWPAPVPPCWHPFLPSFMQDSTSLPQILSSLQLFEQQSLSIWHVPVFWQFLFWHFRVPPEVSLQYFEQQSCFLVQGSLNSPHPSVMGWHFLFMQLDPAQHLVFFPEEVPDGGFEPGFLRLDFMLLFVFLHFLPVRRQFLEDSQRRLTQFSEQHCLFLLHLNLLHLQLEHLFRLHFPEQHSSGFFSLHLLRRGFPHFNWFGHLEHFLLLQSLFLKHPHVFGIFLLTGLGFPENSSKN